MPAEIVIAAVGAGTLGLCAGSFLNVAAHRLPRNMSLVHPPSRCGACGTLLTWHDNLPLVGWLALRGKCRHCGTHFSSRYVLIELLCGVLAAATVIFAGSASWVPVQEFGDSAVMWAALALLIVVFMAVVATVIDLDHQIIPDELTIPLMLVGPWLALLCATDLVHDSAWVRWLSPPSSEPHSIALSTIAMIVGSAVMVIAAVIPLALAVHARLAGAEAWSASDRSAYVRSSLWSVGCVSVAAIGAVALSEFSPSHGLHLTNIVLGYATGWLLPVVISVIGALAMRRNAMGFGDAKLFAPLGAFLGAEGTLWAFMLAAGVGCVIGIPNWLRGGSGVMPFGPALVIGWLIALVAAPWLPLLPWQ